MSLGFFTAAPAARTAVPLLPRCGQCGLHKHCRSPKMPVAGKGHRGILVVGEAPGENEDEQGKPFVGKAGQLLQRNLARVGVDLFRDCWVVNSIRCHPPKNRTPTDKEVSHCLPFLVNDAKALSPRVIVPLGATAVKAVMGWQWKEQVGPVGRWVGWRIPCQRLNAWICPTWHPSYLARQEGNRDYPVLELWFQRHLKAAAGLEERPWPDGPPDYRKKVQRTFVPDAAVEYLRAFRKAGRPMAFDYETDRKKPDHPDARIICCAVSDGMMTLAFPWHGPVVEEMSNFLKSDMPKIAYNAKFEERWTRRVLGHGVRNWAWDGMLAAHVLDNRGGITGLKFQSWVLLGQDSYDHEIKPYLKTKGGGNDANRIREAPLDKLLLYCGLDALLEWEIAQVQAKQLGVKL